LGSEFCKCCSYFKTHYEWRPQWLTRQMCIQVWGGREELKEWGWENYQQTTDRRRLAEYEGNGSRWNEDKCFFIRSLSGVLYGCKAWSNRMWCHAQLNLTPWSRAVFEKPRRWCRYSRTSQNFMEPEGSLPCSQEPVTDSYPKPDQSSPYHTILS
jgi:hypothetical protein